MSYLTAIEFIQRVGEAEAIELTNLDNPSAIAVNTTRLELALTDATSEINGYLANRYDVPLINIPGFIKLYCLDIARYRLAENNAPEAYKQKYDTAIARLKDIEKGQMLLIDDLGVVISRRKTENQLIDERGNVLDDYTGFVTSGGEASFTIDSLSLY